jgi:hypothetical protein
MKTELENADIVAMVRSIDILPFELEAFVRSYREQRKSILVPDLPNFETINMEDRKEGE